MTSAAAPDAAKLTTNVAGDASPPLRHYWPLLLALWIAEIMGSFENSMIYAALAKLHLDLADPVKVGWLVTAYLLIASGAAAVAGRLGDIFGRRRVILILLTVGVIGSLMSALSVNYAMLLGGRALQGLCGAILPLTVGIARENLPARHVSTGIGIMLSGTSVGTAGGLIIGGVIADHFSWHGVFIASALLGVISFIAVMAWIPPSQGADKGQRIDWLGGVLFVPGIILLVSVITYAPRWGLLDPATLALAAGSSILLALWIRASLASADPLLDVRLFRTRSVLVVNLILALLGLGALQITLVFATMLQAPTWTLVGLGVSATLAGLAKAPSNAFGLIAAPLCGRMIARIGGRTTMAVGGALTGIGWVIGMFFHDSVLAVTLVLCLIAFGTTIVFAGGPTVLALTVPEGRTSEAAGMMTVTRQAFMGIGAQMVTVLMASTTISAPGGGASYPTEDAMMLTMGVIAALSFGTMLLALLLPRHVSQPADAVQTVAAH